LCSSCRLTGRALGKYKNERRFIMNNNGELNSKQKKFCEEYLVDFNATKAAVRAGYSKRSAYSIGHENMQKPKIQRYISQLTGARKLKTKVTSDRVLEELAKIGFAKEGMKIRHKLKALSMLGKHVGIFDNQPNLEKQARTRDLSKIDPIEYKNQSIEFYKQVINSPNIPPKLRLTAQKQLDHLLGLDQLSTEDPQEYAAKVCEAIKAADASVSGGEPINPEKALRPKNRACLTIC